LNRAGTLRGAVAADYTTSYTYDAAGRVATVKDALGRITTSVYDNAGNRSSVTGPDGLVTLFTYTVANELKTVTAPDGGVTTYTYDDRGLTSAIVAPDGGKTTFVYDSLGRLWKRIDPRGNVTGATPADFTTTYTYDASGRPTSTKTPTGLVSSTQYSESGYVQARTSPDVGKMDVFPDANGNTTAFGNATVGYDTFFYDTLNRVITKRDHLEKRTNYTYDQNGNVLSVLSPMGEKTTYTYDAANRVGSMVEPRGNVSGAVAANFTTLYTYDIGGNQIKVRNPLGQETVTTYDRVGNVATVTDARGSVTVYTYDAANRIKTVTAPASGTTTYTYTNGRLSSRLDPLGHTTTYTYDLVGRLKTRTDALGRKYSFDYDLTGNLIKTTDAIATATSNAALGTTSVTYDAENRVVLKDFSDSTPDVSFGYNTVGQLATMVHGQGTETYTYGTGADVGRLMSVARNGTPQFTYTYNLNGDVTQRWNTADATFYTYDDDRRMKTVRTGSDATKLSSYTYDAASKPIEVAVVGGWKRSTAYDARMSRFLLKSGGDPGVFQVVV
jgi:YD repeat-containing protein